MGTLGLSNTLNIAQKIPYANSFYGSLAKKIQYATRT